MNSNGRHADTTTDVVVVGAGPVGLLLACELRLGGASVIVLDQRATPMTESRASTLHARVMEHLDARGLVEPLGEISHDSRGHLGGVPFDLSVDSWFSGLWKVPQTLTERVLGDRAVADGADVRREHRVVGLREDEHGVVVEAATPTGTTHVACSYVVGCDGSDSTVRTLVGITFDGTPAARELLRADVTGIDVPARRFQRLERGMATAAPMPGGATRLMVHEYGCAPGHVRDASFARLCRTWATVTGEDVGAGTPTWIDVFDDASLLAGRYRAGRILLAGDAAHQQLPAGGQALNLGLLDAAALGWRLAAVAVGRRPEELLDSYHAERHAAGRRVLTNIEAQTTLLLGGPEAEPTRDVMAELLTYDVARAHLAGIISGTAVVAELDDHVTGDGPRLAAATLEGERGTTTLAELLRTGRGILLDIGPSPSAAMGELVAGWAHAVDVVRVARVRTNAEPTAPDHRTVLVRPDGEIAWSAVGAGDPIELENALRRWFGEPFASSSRTAPATSGDRIPTVATRGPAPDPKPDDQSRERNTRMSDDLQGKTALVTGASRGIGRAIARRLGRQGALVAVHYATNRAAADEVVAFIEGDGGRAFAVQAELGASGDIHELFHALEHGLKERQGSTDLDILVNNAGQMGETAVTDVTSDQFDHLVAVNAKAPFFIIQRALTNLSEGARIVNISSGLTRVANPGEIVYAMTKGAVEQLALHFAKVLAPRGITINSVAPGITRNSNPLFEVPEAVEAMAGLSAFNRVGEPEDVADIVAFLVSPAARWMTGAFVDASGGTLLGG